MLYRNWKTKMTYIVSRCITILLIAQVCLISAGCAMTSSSALTPSDIKGALEERPQTFPQLLKLLRGYTDENLEFRSRNYVARNRGEVEQWVRETQGKFIEQIHWVSKGASISNVSAVRVIETTPDIQTFSPQETDWLFFLDENETILGWLRP